MQHTFCATYKAPTGPRGRLPSDLVASASRLGLRPVFAKWARAYGVPVDLMEGEAWQESGWSNDAVSAAGARGIGQLMPDTVVFVNRSLGTNLKVGVASDNIRMMAAFLGYLLRATGGDTCRAVASYYQGLGTLAALRCPSRQPGVCPGGPEPAAALWMTPRCMTMRTDKFPAPGGEISLPR